MMRLYPASPGRMIDVPARWWKNDDYTVIQREHDDLNEVEHQEVMLPEGWTWLSIRRNDRDWPQDWRELQQIKNQLCGMEREAMQIYPADSRLLDEANQTHLWCAPKGVGIGVGYKTRSIATPEEAAAEGAVQRELVDEDPNWPCRCGAVMAYGKDARAHCVCGGLD